MKVSKIFIDSFDHDSDEPKGLKGRALEIHVLSTSKRVSCFWIGETAARAKRVTGWIKTGELALDNSCGYPWSIVRRFTPIIGLENKAEGISSRITGE